MYILCFFLELLIWQKFKAILGLRWFKRLNPKPQILKLVERLNSTVPSIERLHEPENLFIIQSVHHFISWSITESINQSRNQSITESINPSPHLLFPVPRAARGQSRQYARCQSGRQEDDSVRPCRRSSRRLVASQQSAEERLRRRKRSFRPRTTASRHPLRLRPRLWSAGKLPTT